MGIGSGAVLADINLIMLVLVGGWPRPPSATPTIIRVPPVPRFWGPGRPRTSTVRLPLENFAVRTDAHQPQCRIVRFFVDKKQVGLQRSLAMIRRFTRYERRSENRPQNAA